MIVLKICLALLGLAFSGFGYFIFFRKKYDLINGFTADFKAGKKTESYAKRVGLIEFIIGLVSLTVFLTLLIFA